MKRIISLILAVTVLFSVVSAVSAATPDIAEPMWDNIMTMVSYITFDGTEGTAHGDITARGGITEASGTLTVYRQLNHEWQYVCQVSDTTDYRLLSLNAYFDAEPYGYYKSVFEVSVTYNGNTETETRTEYGQCTMDTSN